MTSTMFVGTLPNHFAIDLESPPLPEHQSTYNSFINVPLSPMINDVFASPLPQSSSPPSPELESTTASTPSQCTSQSSSPLAAAMSAAQVRRAKHRLIDARRRKREQTAVDRLNELCSDGQSVGKRDKLLILEDAVNRLSKQRTKTTELSCAVVLKRQRVDAHDDVDRREMMQRQADASILHASFYTSPVIQVVVNYRSGVCIMRNEACRRFWCDANMFDDNIGRHVFWPNADTAAPSSVSQWVPQVARTSHTVGPLLRGEVSIVDTVGRRYSKDRLVIAEIHTRMWMSFDDRRTPLLHSIYTPADVVYFTSVEQNTQANVREYEAANNNDMFIPITSTTVRSISAYLNNED